MQEPNILSASFKEEIPIAVERLKKGEVILCPTDTIWGLSCDPFNKESYQRLYEIKERTPNTPFVLLVSDIEMLKKYITYIPPRIENLLVFHRRPITLIYHGTKGIPEHCLSSDGTVAFRVNTEPFSNALIHAFGRPITSSSANKSGHSFPRHFGEISSELFSKVDYIVKFGRNMSLGKPSQIFTFDKDGHLNEIRG